MGRKKIETVRGPRNVYFKVSPVLKTTRDVKTLLNIIKSLKRFKKVNEGELKSKLLKAILT